MRGGRQPRRVIPSTSGDGWVESLDGVGKMKDGRRVTPSAGSIPTLVAQKPDCVQIRSKCTED
jgi:hypothetical protein